MNKIMKLFMSLVVLTTIFSSCSPDDYGLGNIDVKPGDLVEGIAYKIEHDASNPNIVYLTSMMGSQYTPLWNHPQGRSQAQRVKLEIPFPGTYEVEFGVETRGGIVYGEKATFKVEDMYAGFISDEMWTMIAGGAGQEKTWYLDLDAEGTSRYFLSPMYFFRKWYTWDGVHTSKGDNYIDAETWDWTQAILPTLERENESESGAPMEGKQAWYWLADYPSNSWMVDKADFGTMTFDLKDAANVVVDQEAYGLGKHTGSFLLDTENHVIKFTDARPLHDTNRDGDDVDWYNVRILYLTKDAMQLGVVPNGDKASMVVYNYISKDYKDNWVPGEVEEPEPPYNGNANNDLATSTSNTRVWTMSKTTPYNWAQLNGALLNEWNSPDDYKNTGWAPYDETMIKNVSLTMTKTGANAGNYTFTDGEGKKIEGAYSVDEKNNINFGKSISFAISGWVSLSTTADNTLRLINTDTDALGNITGMWLGQRDAVKAEYVVYHFEPSANQGGSTDPNAALKQLLSSHTWKLDMDGSVSLTGAGGAGPCTFTDEAYSWTWWPTVGDHYGAGDKNADYGTMKFNTDGTVTIIQNTITDGKLEKNETLKGSWTYTAETKKLKMSVGMLHPSTASFAVVDWGDVSLRSLSDSYLRLWVMRDKEASGEDPAVMMYNFVPVK